MASTVPRRGKPRRLIRFAFAGWVMLLVVVLSAAPRAGEPLLRLVGSAFDPSSISVGLTRKQTDDKRAEVEAGKKDPGETPAGPPIYLAARPAMVAAASAGRMAAPAPAAISASFAVPCPCGRPHGPRAPPLA